MELWLHSFAVPGRVVETARRAQETGYAGLLLADSQNLTADIWVELALAAAATDRLRLGPGVTNPVTRHVAVTASAAATLQAETGGRAVLGFARGDSALGQLGLAEPTVVAFETALARLQGLLRGEEVDLDGTPSTIRWIAGRPEPKVPVHVAATGPHVIAAAARHAEGVDFTLGAAVEDLRAAVAQARAAGSPTLGAYLNVAVSPDRAEARDLVRGSVGTFARFSDAAGAGYDEAHHGESASAFSRRLADDFVDRFAVVGTAAEVTARLREVAATGVQRIVVVPGSVDADPQALARSDERFARDVLPALLG